MTTLPRDCTQQTPATMMSQQDPLPGTAPFLKAASTRVAQENAVTSCLAPVDVPSLWDATKRALVRCQLSRRVSKQCPKDTLQLSVREQQQRHADFRASSRRERHGHRLCLETRRKTVNGAFGTQRTILSERARAPFVDRGDLSGCESLPQKEGDELACSVFDITGDAPWKPRRFCDDEDASVTESNATPTAASAASSGEPAGGESPFKDALSKRSQQQGARSCAQGSSRSWT